MDRSAPAEQIGFVLSKTARLWRSRLDERLAPLGLTQAKWVILLYLSQSDGSLPQRELVDRVGVEGPTLVRVLDGLERKGLIERRDCHTDRRTKSIHLTAEAQPILGEIIRIAGDLRRQILDGISDEEMNICLRVFARMTQNAGPHAGKGHS